MADVECRRRRLVRADGPHRNRWSIADPIVGCLETNADDNVAQEAWHKNERAIQLASGLDAANERPYKIVLLG